MMEIPNFQMDGQDSSSLIHWRRIFLSCLFSADYITRSKSRNYYYLPPLSPSPIITVSILSRRLKQTRLQIEGCLVCVVRVFQPLELQLHFEEDNG